MNNTSRKVNVINNNNNNNNSTFYYTPNSQMSNLTVNVPVINNNSNSNNNEEVVVKIENESKNLTVPIQNVNNSTIQTSPIQTIPVQTINQTNFVNTNTFLNFVNSSQQNKDLFDEYFNLILEYSNKYLSLEEATRLSNKRQLKMELLNLYNNIENIELNLSEKLIQRFKEFNKNEGRLIQLGKNESGAIGDVFINRDNNTKFYKIQKFDKKKNRYNTAVNVMKILNETLIQSILSKKDNELVPRIYGLTIKNKKLYMEMERLNGMNLKNYFAQTKSTPLNLSNVIDQLNILKNIFSSLYYLQNKYNFIHGDLKPDNVYIDNNSQIKFIDFGFSAIEVTFNNSNLSTNTTKDNYILSENYYDYLNINFPYFSRIKFNNYNYSRSCDILYLLINLVRYKMINSQTSDLLEKYFFNINLKNKKNYNILTVIKKIGNIIGNFQEFKISHNYKNLITLLNTDNVLSSLNEVNDVVHQFRLNFEPDNAIIIIDHIIDNLQKI